VTAGPASTRVSKPSGRLPRLPNLHYEQLAWSAGHAHVAGVDEAGRGAWAGPLVAAAVMLPRDGDARRCLSLDLTRAGIAVNDSKQLSPDQRETVVAILDQHGIGYALDIATHHDIDRDGVGAVNLDALRRAALALVPCPQFVVSDAFRLPDFPVKQLALIKGDCRSRSIAFASIVAKVARDRIMIELEEYFPQYGFARHKGYGTADHRAALARHGPCAVHRLSFIPVQEARDLFSTRVQQA
jgi:ribonuclease HII